MAPQAPSTSLTQSGMPLQKKTYRSLFGDVSSDVDVTNCTLAATLTALCTWCRQTRGNDGYYVHGGMIGDRQGLLVLFVVGQLGEESWVHLRISTRPLVILLVPQLASRSARSFRNWPVWELTFRQTSWCATRSRSG